MRLTNLLPMLLLTGCGDIEKLLSLRDAFDAYTNPTVASVSILGVAPAADHRVDMALGLTDLEGGATASAWLVQAERAGGLDGDGLGGQSVRLVVDGQGVGMEEAIPGEYTATGDMGLAYYPLTEARLEIDTAEGLKGLSVGLPDAPAFDLPADHRAKVPLGLDLGGQDYDAAIVMVIDVLTGVVTHEQTPEGAVELYDFARGDDGIARVDIPAEAFPDESVYAVGIAGTWNADAETFDGLNVALTTGFAARFRFATTCTFVEPAMCDAEPDLSSWDE
ncbi:MAG: hypothetical protein VX265_15890 [Myxococcota bacterium]|nr:hypothetical protein [Myxococcota bacterium]